MKLKLKSDFIDYYDHWFDSEGEVFKRMSNGGMDRYTMLVYLSSILDVPKFGIVSSLKYLKPDIKKVVVYLDMNSHKGENKLLLNYEEALEKYPHKLATEYIDNEFGVSMRLLKIGNKVIFLSYESIDDWRSNCGSGVLINIISVHNEYFTKIKYPLYAIDFIFDKDENYYAIDFNIAPGIKGTGVEDILKPKEVVNRIKESILYFRNEKL